MIEIKDIEQAVEAFAKEHEGLFLTLVEIKAGNHVVVEVDHDTRSLDIDTIVALTNHIKDSIGAEVDDYDWEVSSAGLTTPLVGVRRYRKFIGEEIEVLLRAGKKMVGGLKEVTGEGILLEVTSMEKPEGERRKRAVSHDIQIPFDEIKRATYLLRI